MINLALNSNIILLSVTIFMVTTQISRYHIYSLFYLIHPYQNINHYNVNAFMEKRARLSVLPIHLLNGIMHRLLTYRVCNCILKDNIREADQACL